MSQSRSKNAKKKIKTHLAKNENSKSDFVLTESIAWYWWRIINMAEFSNKLLPPKRIEIKKTRGIWGVCTGRAKGHVIISISPAIQNRRLFIATLIHEMVHQYEWQNNEALNHSTNFINWKRYFKKKFGIII